MINRNLCYSYLDYDFEFYCHQRDKHISGADMTICQSKVLETKTNGGAYQVWTETIFVWTVKFKSKQK